MSARSRLVVAGAVAAVAAFGPLGSAGAQLGPVSGSVVEVTAPASVLEDTYESDTEIRAFDEAQGVTLAAPLTVDITSPGDYGAGDDLTPGVIPAGTRVDSHLLHADPAGSPDPLEPVILAGAVTFETKILGVIVLDTAADPHLNDSDGLGAAGTAYPDDVAARGLEFAPAGGDMVRLDGDHTLAVDLVMHRYDQIRVVTAAPPVPVTTTTAPTTTTTTAPVISAAITAPATTTTTAVLPAPQVLGATLPRTGVAVRYLFLVAIVALWLGATALFLGRRAV